MNRELKQWWRQHQQERPKNNRFRLTKQQLYMCIVLFCRFLCHHCTATLENVIFSWQSCSDGTEMYKKMWCTCKVVILLGQAIAFLTFSLSLQSLTLIADDNNTARYQSNLQFIDSQMHWFIFIINQLQNVFQGSKPILPLSIQSAVHLIEVFNNRN